MALAPGTRFGSYEITERVGSGGMGEVYRATDKNLKRDVAIKVLPASFAEDADRVARFQREAEVLASLNHTNIAQIHGLDNVDGETAIVMELVEGPTLAELIAKGPLPPDEALGIARQIAAALEAAHGLQVVHRDLKPANVKVKPAGTVKVLDFGIAKTIDAQAISGGCVPVMTTPAVTETGVIIGTAAYMAPEQARGKAVDQRTDIWAFGCLLFEMLTGQPAFGGEDVMLTLARVLDRDTDLTSVPATISPAVRHTIKLCLEKDPRRRIADIRDVRLALDGAFETNAPALARSTNARTWSRPVVAVPATALVVMAVMYAIFGRSPQAPPAEVRRSVYTIPAGRSLNQPGIPAIAVSPDGNRIAYAADGALYVRELSELSARLVRGTAGDAPIVPVFSPDGSWLLYRSNRDSQLKRIALGGGTPLTVLAESPQGGWRWPVDGLIYYGAGSTIAYVPVSGGEPVVVAEEPGFLYIEPTILSGGEYLLYERRLLSQEAPEPQIEVRSIATGETTVLFPGKQPLYIESGYLIYFDPVLGLMARAFDPATLDYGNPVALVEDVLHLSINGGAQYRVSPTGTLLYVKGDAAPLSERKVLAIADETGRLEPLDVAAGDYVFPSVSPDGRQVVVQRGQPPVGDIFIYDMSGEHELRQLAFDGSNVMPTWTPDGQWITFVSNRDGRYRIYRQRADATGVAEALTDPAEDRNHFLPVWTPDGRLAYVEEHNDDLDLWMVSIPDGTPELLVGGEGQQLGLAFSPSGEAMASMSGASGELEIFAEPYPRDGSRVRISEAGVASAWPVWSRDGARLSYQHRPGGFAAVDLSTSGFAIRDRRGLALTGDPGVRLVDSMPGTGRLLVAARAPSIGNQSTSTELVIVENWLEEVKRRVPERATRR